MRVLVLGSNGQVGFELVRALAPLGEVTALSRAEADLEDDTALQRAIDLHQPEVVVNAAAHTAVDRAESEPERAEQVNHLAVATLARRAAADRFQFVHYSTDYVFGGDRPAPYAETDATGPRSVYGRSKLAGEEAIAASGCRHQIFRTSWVHAGRGGNFIATMLRLARERESLRVVADQVGAPTSAALIADVTATALGRGDAMASGVYHLTASGRTSWHEYARFIVAEALATGAMLRTTADSIVPITTAEYPTAAARPANSLLDTAKLRQALGLELPDWTIHARRSIVELLGGHGP